ncbi:hypothetical protein Tco_1404794 [Tanacetum coccineum]
MNIGVYLELIYMNVDVGELDGELVVGELVPGLLFLFEYSLANAIFPNLGVLELADKVKERSDGKEAEVLKNHSLVTSLKVDDMRKYSGAHVERKNILDFLMGSFLINHNQVVGFKEFCGRSVPEMPARVGARTSGMSSQGNIDHRRMLAQGKCHKVTGFVVVAVFRLSRCAED